MYDCVLLKHLNVLKGKEFVLKRSYHLKSCSISDVDKASPRVSSERSLEYSAVFGSVKECPPLLKLLYTFRCELSMFESKPPVVEKFPTIHGISEVFFPIITFVNISEGSSYSTFCHHRMGFAKQRLAYNRNRYPFSCCLYRGTKSRSSCAYHKNVYSPYVKPLILHVNNISFLPEKSFLEIHDFFHR